MCNLIFIFITQVPDNWKVDLVHLLEDCEDFHTILSDALMEIGTKAIDNIFSKVNLHFYYSIFSLRLSIEDQDCGLNPYCM